MLLSVLQKALRRDIQGIIWLSKLLVKMVGSKAMILPSSEFEMPLVVKNSSLGFRVLQDFAIRRDGSLVIISVM